MTEQAKNGDREQRDGKECVFYDGYWIRWYEPPTDTLTARKELIEQLTRRAFHHTEAGINTPGERLEQAREAYESQVDPALKRVNAAMLAGALFNRATDIFKTVVDLTGKGVEISPSNGLLRQCGQCFKEALKLGKQVHHYSGEEGIDELWGEPLKAFTMPIAAFYESRYLKIAQSMRDIDSLADTLRSLVETDARFASLTTAFDELAVGARRECETMKSDEAIFTVWPEFVASTEAIKSFRPERKRKSRSVTEDYRTHQMLVLIERGTNLIVYIAGARVPMPKSTKAYLEDCAAFKANSFPKLKSVS